MATEGVVILGGARTPMAEYVGAFKDVSALDLGAHASRRERRFEISEGDLRAMHQRGETVIVLTHLPHGSDVSGDREPRRAVFHTANDASPASRLL